MEIRTNGYRGDNLEYMLEGIRKVKAIIDLDALGVKEVVLTTKLWGRGEYQATGKHTGRVYLNPLSKSFQRNYRGYKYKTFGGHKDLTPGGVFAHECGHAFCKLSITARATFNNIRIRRPRTAITSYGNKYLEEDIAEAFRLWVTNPALLHHLDAQRFDTINRHAIHYRIESLTYEEESAMKRQ